MTVQYADVQGWPKEYWDKHFRAVRKLRCAWGDRYTLLTELSGTAYPFNSSVVAYPKSALVEVGGGAVDSSTNYLSAEITVEYSNEIRYYNNTHFMSEEIRGSMEVIQLDYRKFKWNDDAALTSGEAPRLIVPTIDIITSFYNVTAAPAAAVSLLGCVNNASASSYTTGLTFSAGTLLYQTFNMRQDVYLVNTDGFRLEYTFKARPVSWNYYFQVDTNSWSAIKSTATGTAITPHTPADLSALIPS